MNTQHLRISLSRQLAALVLGFVVSGKPGKAACRRRLGQRRSRFSYDGMAQVIAAPRAFQLGTFDYDD